MRREHLFRMPDAEARALLARVPVVHLATTTAAGEPILRTVHGVVLGDAIAFHGAPAGEKMDGMGRAAVVMAEEIVAEVPSYFVDAERACPATTFYRSVQVHGVLEEVDDPEQKASALRLLMEKFQPEGGYVPIASDHPLYAKAIAGLLVARVRFERVDGKSKLGQQRSPEEVTRVAELLWKRGRAGDPPAVKLVLAANPRAARPAFLAAPRGVVLDCALGGDADVDAVLGLLEGAYWLDGVPREVVARSHRGSAAWVGARDERGTLVASARAVSDGGRVAWVVDVCVAPVWRAKGVGAAVMQLLLDHPAVRHAATVRLHTRDAQTFYEPMGFVDVAALPMPATSRTEMALRR
jgi:nitroimidazol reductase NimA-like FMN-containing flavoprotein (pyridoxamine 5'-phosphate oxidase superfamily)/GNAT superfamily N-acetyltransferase